MDYYMKMNSPGERKEPEVMEFEFGRMPGAASPSPRRPAEGRGAAARRGPIRASHADTRHRQEMVLREKVQKEKVQKRLRTEQMINMMNNSLNAIEEAADELADTGSIDERLSDDIVAQFIISSQVLCQRRHRGQYKRELVGLINIRAMKILTKHHREKGVQEYVQT